MDQYGINAQYGIHALVINMATRPERWQKLDASIKTLQARGKLKFLLSHERVEAVSNPNAPSLGCMASHLKCIELAKQRGWDRVLVLEDDAEFPSDVDERWEYLHQALPESTYKIVFGGCSQVRNVKRFNNHLATLSKPFSVVTATHCMIYHQRVYDSIIRSVTDELKNEMLPSHIDLVICDQLAHQVFVACPFIAYYYVSPSDVRRNRNNDPQSDLQQIRLAEEEVKRVCFK